MGGLALFARPREPANLVPTVACFFSVYPSRLADTNNCEDDSDPYYVDCEISKTKRVFNKVYYAERRTASKYFCTFTHKKLRQRFALRVCDRLNLMYTRILTTN